MAFEDPSSLEDTSEMLRSRNKGQGTNQTIRELRIADHSSYLRQSWLSVKEKLEVMELGP
jgi:hypothetical protein